jgi:hypothetical protein
VPQGTEDDLSAARSEEFGFRLCRNIPEALRCGGDRLAVDAVLTVVELGDYPRNSKGQILAHRRHSGGRPDLEGPPQSAARNSSTGGDELSAAWWIAVFPHVRGAAQTSARGALARCGALAAAMRVGLSG